MLDRATRAWRGFSAHRANVAARARTGSHLFMAGRQRVHVSDVT
jgi:hypothetical protein